MAIHTKLVLTGASITRLMRRHKVSIARLSEITGITQERIRQVRTRGLFDPRAAVDWIQAVTGERPCGLNMRDDAALLEWVMQRTR